MYISGIKDFSLWYMPELQITNLSKIQVCICVCSHCSISILTSNALCTFSLLEIFLLKLLVKFAASLQLLYPPPYNRLSLGNKVSAQTRQTLSLQQVRSTLQTAPLMKENLRSEEAANYYTASKQTDISKQFSTISFWNYPNL